MWFGHLYFITIVEASFCPPNNLSGFLKALQTKATYWNANTFGNIFQNIKTILERLDRIQKSPNYPNNPFLHNLETELLNQYDSLLKYEEEFWRTKSKNNWSTEGDSTTTFFHTSTLNRRKKNKINSIMNDVGFWIIELKAIKSHFSTFYS